jgi:hypothetical protein
MNIGDRVRVTIQKNGYLHDVKTGTFLGWTKSGRVKVRLHGLPYGSLSHRFVRNYEPRHVALEMEWQTTATAPFDRDLELAVIGSDGVHALVFPCRRILGRWMNSKTKKPVTLYPTHWREWQQLS